MMIQSSIITVLLVSTCFQSFSMVQAFDPEDAAGFVKPFSDLTGVASTSGNGVLPAGGVEGLVGGLVPDIKSAVGGSLGKRDEPTESGDDSQVGSTHQTSGEGVATYSDGTSEAGGLGALGKDLLAQLKKRYGAADPQADLQTQENEPKTHGKTSVSLLSLRRRDGLGLDQLLGSDQSVQGESESGLAGGLALRRRSLGLLGGDGASDSKVDAQGGTSVSLIGLRKRSLGLLGGGDASDSDVDSQGGTSVSLIGLRRRNTDDKLGDSMKTTDGGETKVSLLNLRRDLFSAGLRDQLERRSTAMLSGTERMDRARQGVVVNSQGDRRAVYARDNGDDSRIIEDYEKLMRERQQEAYGEQQIPSREQEKKGTTNISLASLKKRLVEGVVSSLTDGRDGNSVQGDSDLLGDVTSVV